MLSLCHTLKEVKAFQNQAEGPIVFLLTFWAMYFLMVLYTFFGKFSFSPYFWEPGGHHFLAEVYFCRNYTTERRLKRKKRRWLRWSKLTQWQYWHWPGGRLAGGRRLQTDTAWPGRGNPDLLPTQDTTSTLLLLSLSISVHGWFVFPSSPIPWVNILITFLFIKLDFYINP